MDSIDDTEGVDKREAEAERPALPAPHGIAYMPAVSADGSFAAIAGKYVRGSAAAALSMLGGSRWLADYGRSDPEGFVKHIVSKMLREPAAVVATEDDDVEALLRKLGRKVVDVEPASGEDGEDDAA